MSTLLSRMKEIKYKKMKKDHEEGMEAKVDAFYIFHR